MENNRRSLRLTLLLALGLFALLLFYTSQDRSVEQFDGYAENGYGMDVEVKWIADADQADFAVVQDTLHYYASLIGQYSGAQSARFQLDHCCDPSTWGAIGSPADFYQLHASLDFETPDASQYLLTALMAQGYLELGSYSNFYGMVNGEAHLQLPIPDSQGKVLRIRNSAFQLNFVPRISVIEESPEA